MPQRGSLSFLDGFIVALILIGLSQQVPSLCLIWKDFLAWLSTVAGFSRLYWSYKLGHSFLSSSLIVNPFISVLDVYYLESEFSGPREHIISISKYISKSVQRY